MIEVACSDATCTPNHTNSRTALAGPSDNLGRPTNVMDTQQLATVSFERRLTCQAGVRQKRHLKGTDAHLRNVRRLM